MYTVQVSARKLNLPRLCCCCARPDPSEQYLAEATRESGKRVIKIQTRSWKFPICRECVDWIDVQKAATKSLLTFIIILACAAILIMLGLFVILTPEPSKPKSKPDEPKPSSVPCFVLGVPLAVISPLFYKNWKKKQSKADALKPDPDCDTEPVKYVEWSGTVHTFEFTNRVFCEKFQYANVNKLVE